MQTGKEHSQTGSRIKSLRHQAPVWWMRDDDVSLPSTWCLFLRISEKLISVALAASESRSLWLSAPAKRTRLALRLRYWSQSCMTCQGATISSGERWTAFSYVSRLAGDCQVPWQPPPVTNDSTRVTEWLAESNGDCAQWITETLAQSKASYWKARRERGWASANPDANYHWIESINTSSPLHQPQLLPHTTTPSLPSVCYSPHSQPTSETHRVWDIYSFIHDVRRCGTAAADRWRCGRLLMCR